MGWKDHPQHLTPEVEALIHDGFLSTSLNDKEVAELGELHPATVGRIRKKVSGETSVERPVVVQVGSLVGLANAFGFSPKRLVDGYEEPDAQIEMELEIDEQFVAAAKTALDGLVGLKARVGRVRREDVIGIVGIRIRGAPPERRVYELNFRVPSSA